MIETVNLPNLRRLVANNEKAQNFNLHLFTSSCGTYGCLVGNDWIGQNRGPCGESIYGWSVRNYAISHSLWMWLFSEFNLTFNRFGFEFYCGNVVLDELSQRNWTDMQPALNRVRKFIAYVERKREIMYESDGRVRELARRREGDWDVMASVAAHVLTLAS